MKRQIRKGSLTPEIIRLASEGLNTKEIAARVGCNWPNVYKTLRRYGHLPPPIAKPACFLKISALPHRDRAWLLQESRRTKVNWRDLGRALLIDAINEARNEQTEKAVWSKAK